MASLYPGKGGEAEMWKFRSCPRCGGDIFLDSEEHTWFEHCLQCGYARELKDTAGFGVLSSSIAKGGPAPSEVKRTVTQGGLKERVRLRSSPKSEA
jgi:ribosomal protein S27AE